MLWVNRPLPNLAERFMCTRSGLDHRGNASHFDKVHHSSKAKLRIFSHKKNLTSSIKDLLSANKACNLSTDNMNHQKRNNRRSTISVELQILELCASSSSGITVAFYIENDCYMKIKIKIHPTPSLPPCASQLL